MEGFTNAHRTSECCPVQYLAGMLVVSGHDGRYLIRNVTDLWSVT